MQKLRALGFMSGTSMDGVDAAIVHTDGRGFIELGPSKSLTYNDETRNDLLRARGWAPDRNALNLLHAQHARAFFEDIAADIDIIGFHGQTLAHDPQNARTLQLGDGDRLASEWAVPVVWDFRSDDMAAGGQGAPLAPFFHFHALKSRGLAGRVAVVNIGGVGNITWADLDQSEPQDPGALLAFDTGPGNALMDDLVHQRLGQTFDKGGALAASGSVQEDIVDNWLKNKYFGEPVPKSLDRDDFADLTKDISDLETENALATLCAFTARSIALAQLHFPAPVERWLVTGGGRRNAALMRALAAQLSVPVLPIEQVGLDGDVLEAQAFAWLAVRVLSGLPTSSPGTTGCRTPVCGGRISTPDHGTAQQILTGSI